MIKKITSLKDIRLQDILNTERLNRTIQNIQDSLKKWDEKLMKEAIIAGLKVQTRLGSKEAKKELKRYNIRDREKQIIRASGGSSCYVRTRTGVITGREYMDCQPQEKTVAKLSKV